MISPALIKSVVAIAGTCAICLAVVMVLGHYLASPPASALLGCFTGCCISGRRYLRRHRQIRGRW